jgi:phosphatidylglycerol---prolipoprotein diacylglyceryl transferase
MITINIDPIIFSIGHFALRWYGLIVLAAVATGIWVGTREARRRGFDDETIQETAFWGVMGGILGARLFHVLDHWGHNFAADPIRALYIWEGGLAIWGGVVGGVLTVAILAWRRGWRFSALLDAAAPGLVLAQAIGRVACIITGDAMGKATSGPIGFAYLHPNALVPELGVYYIPMPVYEIIANLLIFGVLWQLRKRNWPSGMLFLVYLSLYSLERLLLGFTSSYQILAFGLTQSQIIAITGLTLAIWLLYRKSMQTRALARANS